MTSGNTLTAIHQYNFPINYPSVTSPYLEGKAIPLTAQVSGSLTPRKYLKVQQQSDFYTGRWRNEAACNELDPLMFFPQRPEEPQPYAMAVCLEICPVRLQCLTYALVTHQNDGLWGGTTPKTRRKLRRKLYTALRTMRERGDGISQTG